MTLITFAAIIGILTVILGILVKAIGFPDQFRINLKRKSTKNVTTHGILRKDWVLIAGQGVGILTTGMIIAQIILYRKKEI